MAVFKLGGIITDITGSIGGTTFVRGKQSLFLQNKNRGASKSKLLQNKRLSDIAEIWRKWSNLTLAVRTVWNQKALLFTFPDKFGVLRIITGRQLFTKLNIQALPANFQVLSATGIYSTTSNFNFNSVYYDYNAQEFFIFMKNINEDGYFLFSFEVSKNKLFAPIFSRRKILFSLFIVADIGVNVWEQFMAEFPYVDSSYNIRVFATNVNAYGFKSVMKYKDANII